jgi:hypothetical protein
MKLNTSPRSTRLSHRVDPAHVADTPHDRVRARGPGGAAPSALRSFAALGAGVGCSSDSRLSRGGATPCDAAPPRPGADTQSLRHTGRTRDDRSLNHAPTERVRSRPTTRAASGGCAQPCRSCGHGCRCGTNYKPNHKPAEDAISGIPCTSSCSIRGLFTWPRGASCACRSRPAVAPLSTARRENNCPIGNCPIGPSPPAERGELFRAPGARQ